MFEYYLITSINDKSMLLSIRGKVEQGFRVVSMVARPSLYSNSPTTEMVVLMEREVQDDNL